MDKDIFLSLKNITKTFPGVVALDDVSLDFRKGEVHAILGENGAGKSTLIKTISGALAPDIGSVEVNGCTYEHMTPQTAKKNGIGVIYQEFNLVEPLTVAENIFLGERFGKTFNFNALSARAQRIFDEWEIDLNPADEVRSLSPGKKQLVEISKCLSHNVGLLILDEPTAPLSTAEVEMLYRIIERLKENGETIIYISHRLDEIFRISDRVSVLRDGRHVVTAPIGEMDRSQLVSYMVGRPLKEDYPVRSTEPAEEAFRAEGVTGNGDSDISFCVRKGEIYGFAGLVGAGRTELAQMIFGIEPKQSGRFYINSRETEIRSPGDAIAKGLGLIPEDRKFLGCIQELSIMFNVSISALKQICRGLVINNKKERELVGGYSERLKIKAPSLSQAVKNLSGGNQQKVVIAKVLAAKSDILIFDEPTRGIDIGAKQEIYRLMNELAEQGKAIIMISSELEELIGMSDRIGIIYEGRLTGELERSDFDQKLIIGLASGLKREEITCQG